MVLEVYLYTWYDIIIYYSIDASVIKANVIRMCVIMRTLFEHTLSKMNRDFVYQI